MSDKNTVEESKNVVGPNTVANNNILNNTGDLFQNKKNRNFLLIVVAIVTLIIAGGVGFYFYTQTQNQTAQEEMFPAVFAFEADSLKKALNGDGANQGLVDIADTYSMTDAGNLSDFYVGVAYMKQGKFDEAIDFLKKFKSSDLLVQGRAYCLLGDAYMEKNSLSEAVKYYKLASEYKPNKFFTPGYLIKLALAQEKNKDNEGAIKTYDEIIEKYYDSAEMQNAKKYKSKLEGLTAK